MITAIRHMQPPNPPPLERPQFGTEAYTRWRYRWTVYRWHTNRIMRLSAKAEAALQRWVLTGSAADLLETRINTHR